mgnify:FL=1
MLKDYSSYVTNQYTITEADIKDDDVAAANLNAAYGDLGFKFEPWYSWGTQAIKITNSDDVVTIIQLDYQDIDKAIHNFINLNTPLLTIGRLDKSGSLPKSDKKEGEVDAFGNPI